MADWNPVVSSVNQWSGHGEIGVSIGTLTGEHWEFHADRRFVAASTIKIPVMITLYRQIDQCLHTADELIALGDERIPGSGVLQHMHEGLELTVDDLCTLMIAISDNTATNMLVDLVGLDQVNRTIRDLGMLNSTMGRKMLGRRATSDDGENWVTPADLTTSVRQILDGCAASTGSCHAMKIMLTRQDQSRKVTRFAPEGSVWGSKTGGLPGIVNDAGFIETDRGAVVISVCTAGFVRDDQADLAIAEISSAALRALKFVG